MRIFVTGGTGFTGDHLIERLVKEKHEVKALVRSTSNTEKLKALGVSMVTADIADRTAIFEATRDIDWVFNIAAAYREASLSNERYWQVNFEATRNILDACIQNNVKKYIHCSTIGVVTTVKEPPGSEESEVCPGDVYQRSKCAAEQEVIRYSREKGLAATVIRPCAIYGPGDMRLLKLFRMISKKRFIFFGNGKAFLHLVYVENLVDGFLLAAEKEESNGEIFIIGDEHYVSLNELSRLIAEEFGVSAPKIHLPYLPFELLARAVEFTWKKLKIKSEPPVYRRRMAFFKKSRAFKIDKARDILGYAPAVDLRTGIHLTAEWYTKHGYIKQK